MAAVDVLSPIGIPDRFVVVTDGSRRATDGLFARSNPVSQNSAPVCALLDANLNVSQINLRPGSPFAPVFFLPELEQGAVPVPPETLPPIALDWRKLGEVHKGARQTLDKG